MSESFLDLFCCSSARPATLVIALSFNTMLAPSARTVCRAVPVAAARSTRLLSTQAHRIHAVHRAGHSSTTLSRRSFSSSPSSSYANPSPAATAVAHSENPVLPSLHTFTEEEELLRDTVRKFSEEMVAPKVREMDESEKMDPSIIQGLFENGVSDMPHSYCLSTLCSCRIRG